ncbi:MAG: hypothetical protein RL637_920 [Pseudomonadota bacterium]
MNTEYSHLSIEQLYQLGLQHQQAKQFVEAEKIYHTILQLQPNYADVLHFLGVLKHQQQQDTIAIQFIRQAIQLNPNNPLYYGNLGVVLRHDNQLEAAINCYQQAISLYPEFIDAYNNLGVVYKMQKNYAQAIDYFQQALHFNPNNSDVLTNLASTYKEMSQLETALELYKQILTIQPTHLNSYQQIGQIYFQQQQFDLAIQTYRELLSIDKNCVEGYLQLATVLKKIGKLRAAAETYQQLIQIQPNQVEYHHSLGIVFQMMGKMNLAMNSYQIAYSLNPDYEGLLNRWFHAQLYCCEWSDYDLNCQRIFQAVQNQQRGFTPFASLSVLQDVELQQQCARTYMAHHHPFQAESKPIAIYQHSKIRLAYLSADFHEHPVSYLIVGIFEHHHRDQFEIIGLSLKPEDKSPIAQRVKAAFDEFIEVSDLTDEAIAQLLRDREIDIAIDLMGITRNSRPSIFSYRAAPIQVNYLGFPGTMGVNYIDYIIADAHIIPEEHQLYYDEKVVYLPDTYLPSDHQRQVADYTPTRAELNLPENAFIFCSFNNSYKFSPNFFAIWMRLLAKVENSVLWLPHSNELAIHNLQQFALNSGIDSQRLIFAPRTKTTAEHLTRLKVADLFLDTLPYNAHTTASDALWVGLPLITCMGNTFAGRVAGSLLMAIGLPELITKNLIDYEALALKLALNPQLLKSIRQKLENNKNTYPLFNTERFTRHLESAYLTMWQNAQQGIAAKSFSVANIETMNASIDHLFNQALAYQQAGDFQSAEKLYQQLLQFNPNHADALHLYGVLNHQTQRDNDAIQLIQKAIEINPNHPAYYGNLGIIYRRQNQFGLAMKYYQKAIEVNPEFVDAYNNLAVLLERQGKMDLALKHYRKTYQLNPNYDGVFNHLFHTQLHCADWNNYESNVEKLITMIQQRQFNITPFPLLCVSDSAKLQQLAAETYMLQQIQKMPEVEIKSASDLIYRHNKIRVAYISADFREHPITYLMCGLFEIHQRQQFEIIGISLMAEEKTPTGQRVKTAFDEFIDVSQWTDQKIIQELRQREIDIAVDLTGITSNYRSTIFAARVAPIQINYLGYPATMGVKAMDYIIADPFLIPESQRSYCSEQIIYLPDCFQVNDDKRLKDLPLPSRKEAGLPDQGFIFCSFNNSYKINPPFFDIWMRLLIAVKDSVLWLVGNNPEVREHFYYEAKQRGVNPERLIFTERLPYSQHLARFPLADLFLDTLPFNAGTTASDALWMGVPVLTCVGEAFAARMAGSLLTALNLPELITQNLIDYEALALKLATDTELLKRIRQKLAINKQNSALFNTKTFAIHLEWAYQQILQKAHQGLAPQLLMVPKLIPASEKEITYLAQLLSKAQNARNAGQFTEAENVYQQILQQQPDHAEATHWLGILYHQTGHSEKGVNLIQRSIELNPNHSGYYCNLGVVLSALKQIPAAIHCYQQALQRKKEDANVYYNLGNAYKSLGQMQNAIESYQQAVHYQPKHSGAFNNLGETLRAIGQISQAIDCYQKVLQIQPQHIDALFNCGCAYETQNQFIEAEDCYRQLLAVKPDYAKAIDALFYLHHHRCNWRDYDLRIQQIKDIVKSGNQTYRPFAFLHVTDQAELQLRCGQTYAKYQYPISPPLWQGELYTHSKIRVAYLSADFNAHAVSYLMLGIWEQHHRNRFEIYGLSFCGEDSSVTGQRVKAAFDHFIDISHYKDQQVALLLRQLEIDIAIDCMGYTKNNRTAIFAARPVPVQINYLGFPATMGAEYIDYIIGDRFLIPSHFQIHYQEKVVYLPECFQANDSQRAISDLPIKREDYSLPESAFVFCAFNTNYKLTPTFFAIWMQLLADIPNSVLWLIAYHEETQNNLRQTAANYGIDPHRLYFAKWQPYSEHLARFKLADLFLDTLPFNAGTTASDALWAGLPVLTCSGSAFAARMAGSLLQTIGLAELVTESLADYQAMAMNLATDPTLLTQLRQRLQQHRSTHALFNTQRFLGYLETAYIAMWQRVQQKLPARTLVIATTEAENIKVNQLLEQGLQHLQAGQFDAAEACYQQILQLKPHHAQALHYRGLIYSQRQSYLFAQVLIKQAIVCEDDLNQKALYYSNLAVVYEQQQKLDAAISAYQQALSLLPQAALYLRVAQLAKTQQQPSMVEAYYQQAIELQPNFVEAYRQLAMWYRDQGQFAAAIQQFQQLIRLQPEDGQAHFDLALVLLTLGRYAEAWTEHEYRYHVSRPNRRAVPPPFRFPQWQGQSLENQSIVIYPEQGLGDEIQFCRYFPLLKQQGASKVTVFCKSPLKSLFERLSGVDEVKIRETVIQVSPHDYWVFPLSLPLHFQTRIDNIPATVPYLSVGDKFLAQKQQELTTLLAGKATDLKVGICWQGNPQFNDNARRSPGIAAYKPLFALSGIQFFTLQPDTREVFLANAGKQAADLGRELDPNSFEDAASLIHHMDLIISSDTSIAHLAGALGKPLWLLLMATPDWRWGLSGETNPWYPTAKLFRQTQAGEWTTVIEQVLQALQKYLSDYQQTIRQQLKVAFKQYHTGDYQAAVQAYQQLLSLNPYHPEACHWLGVSYQQQGKFTLATEWMQRSIQLDPENPSYHCNLGVSLAAQQRLPEAITSYQHGLMLTSSNPSLYYNLGNAYRSLYQYELAVTQYQQAIALKPQESLVYNNLALTLHDQGRFTETVAVYQQLINLTNDPIALAQAYYNCSLSLLQIGDYIQGWEYYEYRYHENYQGREIVAPQLSFPQWQGESLIGKSILICPEQGLGDQLQFCRYVSVLKQQFQAAWVTLVCKPPLVEVCQTVPGVNQVIAIESTAPIFRHDYWVFALSLPLYCKTTVNNIPATIPYLFANPQQIQQIANELATIKTVKVGLCWKGNPNFKNDGLRSPGIKAYQPFFALSGVHFFTLQPNTREEFLAAAGEKAIDRGHDIDSNSFAEAAALIMNMDLVISSCTSIVHLAAALGKPVWVLLPQVADWRWLTEREDSPWYPTVRLFRQTEFGDWTTVVQRVVTELKTFINQQQHTQITTWFSQGLTHHQAGRLVEAENCYQQVLQLQAEHADTLHLLGALRHRQNLHSQAIQLIEKAIELNPYNAVYHANLAIIFKVLGQMERSKQHYERASELNPQHEGIFGQIFYTQLQCCDWVDYFSTLNKIETAIANNQSGYLPFISLLATDSAELHYRCALRAAENYPPSATPLWQGNYYAHNKIRVAYLSVDFREHPVSYLLAAIIEHHDRNRFEISGWALQPSDNSLTGQRIKAAFDEVIEVSLYSDEEIAQQLRQREIDIAIDLTGLTRFNRTGILALRPVPIQINYLGYPGTMGVNYIDYLIADSTVIPPNQQQYYTEQLVYLPNCYLPGDNRRQVETIIPTRAELNLPEHAFVFCSFNNHYKINPPLFEIWMRLLATIQDSVLWLSQPNELATAKHLRCEIQRHGIDPQRLIFADRTPTTALHLARLQQADLFLDTLPYNAHTTATDALWVGLPLITCMGKTFAGRVASSALLAIGIPELITHNLAEYEALAIKLATDSHLLAQIRQKLTLNRKTYPLFNTAAYTKHLEKAFEMMWQRSQQQLPPQTFGITD